MAIIPIRNLGSIGVISDQSPFLLPPQAFTAARNVRFAGGRVTAGAAFRLFRTPLLQSAPALCRGLGQVGGFDQVLVCGRTGFLHLVTPTTDTDVSPAGATETVTDDPWTSCTLSGVHYANRDDRAPFKLGPADTQFSTLANWPAGMVCRVLRNYGSRLVALNLVESGSNFPVRVRFSEAAFEGAEPETWDATDTTKTAGFNDLAEVREQLLDGLQLGPEFILYGPQDTYRMALVNGQEIMDFVPVWNDFGIIGANCVAQVGQQHAAFGRDDIVVHDGVNRQSIIDERVRRRIYDYLDWRAADKCFVVHDKANREVYFCYRSTASDVYWSDTEYCNEAMVWNYTANTCTFRDLPNVGCASVANAASGESWDEGTASWDTEDGAWGAGEGSEARSVVFPAVPDQHQADPKLLILDGYGPDNRLALPLYAEFSPVAYAERSQIALDSFGLDLRTYKRLRTIYPLIISTGVQVAGQAGGALYPTQPVNWGPLRGLDSTTGYKIDWMTGGRYLGFRLVFTGQDYFELAGVDLDLVTKGRR